MSIAEVEVRAVAVITLLRNGSRASDAHDMARIVAGLRQTEKIEGALEGIIARCNIRWLGDLPLNNVASTLWLQKLGALESAARAELLLVRNRASQGRKAAYEKRQRNTSRRTANRKAASPWTPGSSQSGQDNWRTNSGKVSRTPPTTLSKRTLSAPARDRGGKNNRWTDNGPILRAETPFWVLLLFFLPPFALIAYSVLVVVDSAPDLFPPETVLVEGIVERWELRENYLPHGVKGVIILQSQEVDFGVHEALGYGFADSVDQLQAGDSVSMRVDADMMFVENSRVAAAPIPILELRVGNDTKYSRLQLVTAAEERIRNWGFLGFAAFFFLIMAAGLRAR